MEAESSFFKMVTSMLVAQDLQSANPLSAQGLANLGGVPQVNNRAFGVAGPGQADINFTPGFVEEVILQVRGTD